jgi:hypothetical protein
VISFQNEAMAALQPNSHELSGNAEIGTHPKLEPLMLDHEPGGFACVMSDCKGVKRQVPDRETKAALKDL